MRLLVVGEKRADNTYFYPLHPDRPREREQLWEDHPDPELGPHDGMPDKVRAAKTTR